MGMLKRDNLVVIDIEDLGSMTPMQCGMMFFVGSANATKLAMERLQQIYKWGKIKRNLDKDTGILQYYMTKKMTPHGLKLLDFNAMLVQQGYKILKFDRPYKIAINGNFEVTPSRSIDGVFYVEKNGVRLKIYLEIDDNHKTSDLKLRDVCNQLDNNKLKSEKNGKMYDYTETFVIIRNNPRNGPPLKAPIDKNIYFRKKSKLCGFIKDFNVDARILPWDFFGYRILAESIMTLLKKGEEEENKQKIRDMFDSMPFTKPKVKRKRKKVVEKIKEVEKEKIEEEVEENSNENKVEYSISDEITNNVFEKCEDKIKYKFSNVFKKKEDRHLYSVIYL